MVIVMGRRRFYLWRAVDSEGEVLDFLVQRRRNTRAAERLMRKLLKRQGFAPSTIVTDNSARMVLRKRNLVCTRFMSKACGRIIGVRIRICLSADASISNSASSPLDQHSAF